MPIKQFSVISLMILALIQMPACTNPDQQKSALFAKGQICHQQGEYEMSRLHLKNALKLDPSFAEGYYWLGLTELKLGNIKLALSAFLRAIENDPLHLPAHVQAGRIMLAAGMPAKALEWADQALSVDQGDKDAQLLKASVLLDQRKRLEAIAILEPLVVKDPACADAYELLATAAMRQNSLNQALKWIQAGLSASPAKATLMRLQAEIFSRQKNIKAAVTVFNQLMQLQPDHMDHPLALAGLLWDSQDTSEAQAVLDRLQVEHAGKEMLWSKIGQFYISKNQFDLALSYFQEGLIQNPRSFHLRLQLAQVYAHFQQHQKVIALLNEHPSPDRLPFQPEIQQSRLILAKSYLARGEIEKASQAASNFLSDDPLNAQGHLMMGRIYLQQKNGPNAALEFGYVVKNHPDLLDARLALAEALSLNQKWPEAEKTLTIGLSLNPNHSELRLALFRLYTLTKDYPKAETQLRAIIKKNPTDMDARVQLGDFLISIKAYDKARREFQELKRKAPDHPLAYIGLSRLFGEQGNGQDAIAELEGGLFHLPGSDEILTALVDLYAQKRKFSAAVAVCEDRIKGNDQDALAYHLLGRIYLAQKKHAKAKQAFQAASQLRPTWQEPRDQLTELEMQQNKK